MITFALMWGLDKMIESGGYKEVNTGCAVVLAVLCDMAIVTIVTYAVLVLAGVM